MFIILLYGCSIWTLAHSKIGPNLPIAMNPSERFNFINFEEDVSNQRVERAAIMEATSSGSEEEDTSTIIEGSTIRQNRMEPTTITTTALVSSTTKKSDLGIKFGQVGQINGKFQKRSADTRGLLKINKAGGHRNREFPYFGGGPMPMNSTYPGYPRYPYPGYPFNGTQNSDNIFGMRPLAGIPMIIRNAINRTLYTMNQGIAPYTAGPTPSAPPTPPPPPSSSSISQTFPPLPTTMSNQGFTFSG